MSFWRSGLLVAVPLALIAFLDHLTDVILYLWPIHSVSCTLEHCGENLMRIVQATGVPSLMLLGI